MARDTTVQFRIDADVKEDAFAVFREMGITPSEAVRVFFKQVQKTRTLPFVVTTHPEPAESLESGYTEWLRDRLSRTIARLDAGTMPTFAGDAARQVLKVKLAAKRSRSLKPLTK
jgi:addiction module RelB/DinJ family antitoxin